MCRVLEGWYTAFVRALAGITSMERVYKSGRALFCSFKALPRGSYVKDV